jgi:hypothetical protein
MLVQDTACYKIIYKCYLQYNILPVICKGFVRENLYIATILINLSHIITFWLLYYKDSQCVFERES